MRVPLRKLSIWIVTLSAFAQSQPAPMLHGRVTDERGQPAGGASVVLTEAGAGRTVTSLTLADGEFGFNDVRTNIDYEVHAEDGLLASAVHPVRLAGPDEKAGVNLRLRAPIRFDEIGAAAGIDFTLRNGETGQAYQPEIMPGGVAAFDYNNDGCMDLFFANGAELPSGIKRGPDFYNRLYRNNCDGTFSDVTRNSGLAGEGYSIGVAAGDYDNDGFTDLLVTGLNGFRLYRNRRDGTFEDVTVKAGLAGVDPKYGRMWSTSAGWFDFDNDGKLDLFVSNYVTWKAGPEPQCAIQGKPYYCHPRVYSGLPNQLFRNNGDGTFSDVSEASGIRASVGKGMGVAFGDFNGDNLIDVFVANDSVPNFLFENLGNGKFREVALKVGVAYLSRGSAVAGMGADFRDFDDDGLEDIALDAMYFDTFPLFRNRGKPSFFADETTSSGVAAATYRLTGWGMGLFDFDNDGHKDLFFATSHFPGSEPFVHAAAQTANVVLHNNGQRFFDDVSALAGAGFQERDLYRGVAFADFDNDGRIDAAVSVIGGRARLFRNVSPQDSHWIALRLEGTRSNRQGIGASVRLTLPTGRVLYNRASTTVGYASSSEPLVRLGLGPYNSATTIEVRWPGGQTQLLHEVAGDRIVTVREP